MRFKQFIEELTSIESGQAVNAHEPTGEASSAITNPKIRMEVNYRLANELYGPKITGSWGIGIKLSQEVGYVHEQTASATTWTINHNLEFVPNITVVDTFGTVVEGSYDYPNDTTVVLTFSSPFSGKAFLS